MGAPFVVQSALVAHPTHMFVFVSQALSPYCGAGLQSASLKHWTHVFNAVSQTGQEGPLRAYPLSPSSRTPCPCSRRSKCRSCTGDSSRFRRRGRPTVGSSPRTPPPRAFANRSRSDRKSVGRRRAGRGSAPRRKRGARCTPPSAMRSKRRSFRPRSREEGCLLRGLDDYCKPGQAKASKRASLASASFDFHASIHAFAHGRAAASRRAPDWE
jgi:hypothetical protein